MVTLHHGSFSRFLNCTNGGTSRKRHYCRVHERDQFLTKKKDNDQQGQNEKKKELHRRSYVKLENVKVSHCLKANSLLKQKYVWLGS